MIVTKATCTECKFTWQVAFGRMPNTTRCPNCDRVAFNLIKTENVREQPSSTDG